MNATINQYYDGLECNFKVEFRHRQATAPSKSSNRPSHSRRGQSPLQFNGIHRRRRKKIMW